LRHENDKINAEQREKNGPLARRPAGRIKGSFSAGQAHGAKISQTLRLVIGKAGLEPCFQSGFSFDLHVGARISNFQPNERGRAGARGSTCDPRSDRH
jgi:hypothetical protein